MGALDCEAKQQPYEHWSRIGIRGTFQGTDAARLQMKKSSPF